MAKKIFWISLIALILPSAAKASFGFHAGTHFSYGKMANQSLSLAERTTSTFDLQFMPGYRLAPYFLAGLMIDYRFVNQNASAQDMDNNDISGRSLLIGPGISFEPGLWKFLVAYDIKASHSYNFRNTETSYKGSGFHLLFGYEIARELHFDFQMVKCSYNNQTTNNTETDISGNPVEHWSLGFGLSYSY